MVSYIKEEKNINRSDLIDIRVFQLITKNTIKQLKMKQKTYKITKNIKTIKATLKQIAN